MKELEFVSLEPSVIPHPDREKILVFLKHGFMIAAAPGIPTDRLTGERIPCEMITYESCGYSWTSIDIWHFETYNFQLPDDFIEIARDHYPDHFRNRNETQR